MVDSRETRVPIGKSASRTKARVINHHSSFDVASIGYFRDSEKIDSDSFSGDAIFISQMMHLVN